MPEKKPHEMSLDELLAQEQSLNHAIRELTTSDQDKIEALINEIRIIKQYISKGGARK